MIARVLIECPAVYKTNEPWHQINTGDRPKSVNRSNNKAAIIGNLCANKVWEFLFWQNNTGCLWCNGCTWGKVILKLKPMIFWGQGWASVVSLYCPCAVLQMLHNKNNMAWKINFCSMYNFSMNEWAFIFGGSSEVKSFPFPETPIRKVANSKNTIMMNNFSNMEEIKCCCWTAAIQ